MKPIFDPSLLDTMSDDEAHTNALADSDNLPWSQATFQAARRTSQAKIIRRALELTQEEFASRYQIPLGTLRDWEQDRTEPDQTAKSYLRVIASDPDGTAKVFAAKGAA